MKNSKAIKAKEIYNSLISSRIQTEEEDKKLLSNIIDEEETSNQPIEIESNEEQEDNFIVNEFEFEQFKLLIKDWLKCDDEIRIMTQELKERKKIKTELTPKIKEFMKIHKLYNLKTKNSKIQFKTTTKKKPISQKIIKERIIDYFKTEEEGEKCIEFIYAKQETITVDSIKRTRQKSDKMDNIYKKNHPFYKK